jgi:hypothetical protein
MKNIHQNFLISDMRGRSICHEHELEVVDDAVDHGEIC